MQGVVRYCRDKTGNRRQTEQGKTVTRNAIYVSYLEHLDFRSDAGKEAKRPMPSELEKGRIDALDYDERLLGRKWPLDDRCGRCCRITPNTEVTQLWCVSRLGKVADNPPRSSALDNSSQRDD